jgi:hypothetical protein
MTMTFRFSYEELVRHRLNGFEGAVIGIAAYPKPSAANCTVEYLVLPVSDCPSNCFEPAVWINSCYLEPAGPRRKRESKKTMDKEDESNGQVD